MLKHTFLAPSGVLILEPGGPLAAADFADLAREIDPYIALHGHLSGVLVHATVFPGWANLEAFLAHVRFIESHHQKIRRLAVVSDSALLTELPKLVAHLVHPDVKHFPEAAYEDAVLWLKEADRRTS